MEKIKVNVERCPIISVEKGSILSKPTSPVIAFSVDSNGAHVKAIVKGDLARTLWDNFLKEGKTQATRRATNNGGYIDKSPVISFIGELRDFRPEGVVLDNISDVKFDFNYTVNV